MRVYILQKKKNLNCDMNSGLQEKQIQIVRKKVAMSFLIFYPVAKNMLPF